jgi:hypothetical protein
MFLSYTFIEEDSRRDVEKTYLSKGRPARKPTHARLPFPPLRTGQQSGRPMDGRTPHSGRHEMRRMATILTILAITLGVGTTLRADVYVRGYYRSNGTYVQPHWRSNPDGKVQNNWSTYPNVNPYTGARGTKRAPSDLASPSYRTPTYGQRTYSDANPYTGATGTKKVPNHSGSPSSSAPSYNWSSPNLWNSRSPSVPSLSRSDYDVSGRSRRNK